MRWMGKTCRPVLALGVWCAGAGLAAAQTAGWPSAGRDLENSRYETSERKISASNASLLQPKWAFTTDGDVTATPAVDAGHVYFPDSAGFLYKVKRTNGALVWKRPISGYTGIPGDYARATPVVAGKALIFGNQSGKLQSPAPARMVAVDKETGNLLWSTRVDDTLFSFVTTSAVVVDGTVIVGTASNEELVAALVPPDFWQWTFRGSAVALDVATGAIKWRTYTVPPGYFGGAIWGSTPAVDRQRNQVYVATGNNYSVPPAVVACLKSGQSEAACMAGAPTNYFNSIIALDLTTGAIKWGSRAMPYDAWNVACGLSIPFVFTIPGNFFGAPTPGAYGNCPDPIAPSPDRKTGPDWDFAQGPMIFSGPGALGARGLVGAGQKSGKFWAFRATDGALVWSTQVAPGGVTGGLQWGSATDGQRLFVAAANSGPALSGGGSGAEPWTLRDGTTTTAGGWASLDAKTGQVLWTTADPSGSRAEGAVSGANGVIFGCNLDFARGTMYALDAKTGTPLWSFDSGGACNAGPSISDGMVFWGTGTFSGFGPKKVFAFGLN
jgi:polyvinyl alcohol dehydrogenase (cytochrome)